MRAAVACLLGVAGFSGVVAAEEQPLICFGNEPSWSVDLTEPGVARFATPDQEAVTYRGQATRHAFLPETSYPGAVGWPRRLRRAACRPVWKAPPGGSRSCRARSPLRWRR